MKGGDATATGCRRWSASKPINREMCHKSWHEFLWHVSRLARPSIVVVKLHCEARTVDGGDALKAPHTCSKRTQTVRYGTTTHSRNIFCSCSWSYGCVFMAMYPSQVQYKSYSMPIASDRTVRLRILSISRFDTRCRVWLGLRTRSNLTWPAHVRTPISK